MEDEMESEDMVYIGDVDEVLEAYAGEELEPPQDDEEEEAVHERLTEADGDATCVFRGHKFASVFCCSLSKNGKLAVSGGEDDRAFVWDADTGEVVLQCTGHKDSVIFAEMNHDETYLATGDMSGVVQVWRMSDKACIWNYTLGDATWMKWHMAANVLLTGSVEGEVYMWKVPSGDCKVFQGSGCGAEIGAIFPDGKRLAIGYSNGKISVVDLKTSSVLATVPPTVGHKDTITALDCHTDNNLILSVAVDGRTILSSANNGKVLSMLQSLKKDEQRGSTGEEDAEMESDGHWAEAAAFCRDPSFNVAATGTTSGDIYVWDIAKQVLRQRTGQESGITKILWKGTTSIFFTAGTGGVLRCYDARSCQCLRSFEGHATDIFDIYISENGERLLTASDDSTARIFDIRGLP